MRGVLLKAAILGAGRIGCGCPDGPDGTPRNHLAAIIATPGVEAEALVDPDDTALKAARDRYGNLESIQQVAEINQLTPQSVADPARPRI